MTSHISTKAIGDRGEDIAVQFLQQKGYTILERNWRSSTFEIDIICLYDGFLVFVEVKYRKNSRFGEPADFITASKMHNLSMAAGRYTEDENYSGLIRFDVLGIRPDQNDNYKIRHLEDVYFKGWDP